MKWLIFSVMFFMTIALTQEQAQILFQMKLSGCPKGTTTVDMTGDGSVDMFITMFEPQCNSQIEKEFKLELEPRGTKNTRAF